MPIKSAPYQFTFLADIQAFIDPKRPLEERSEPEQNSVLSDLAGEILGMLGQSVRIGGDARQRLMEDVKQRLGGRFEALQEISCGDTSIVFKGRQGLREYAVKVLTSGGVSSGERDTLQNLVDEAAKLVDPAYIKVHEAFLDGDPICIVSEYVMERPLSHVLHDQSDGLSPSDVILYIKQLARALQEAHEHKLFRRKLLPSNIFVQGSRVRLSPIVFLTETKLARWQHRTVYSTREAFNYIAPEDYYELPTVDEATDQYALSRVIARMLCKDPRDRWDSECD
jgi:serine/threonine protein kinase